MEEVISKKEFDEMMKIEGKIRGAAIKGYADFILEKEGERGLKKLEDTITKLGYPIKYKEIKIMDFYPLGVGNVIQLAVKKLFNYDEKDFQEMGGFYLKISLFNRIFMKYFFSIDKIAEKLPKVYKQHVTVGDLEVVELNKEEKYVILRLKNPNFPYPSSCQILMGIWSTGVGMMVKSKTSCKETKCVFRGDPYHEFLLKW